MIQASTFQNTERFRLWKNAGIDMKMKQQQGTDHLSIWPQRHQN